MRTIACKTVWALLIGVSLVLSLNSCSKDPVIPEDETKNKLHEDPAKMTVRLVECHLHADWNEIQKAGGPHQNPESPARYMKRVQEITYELKTGSGWTLAEGSQGKFYVQKNGEYKNGNNFTPAPVYLMFIYYYNSKGELMNGQFVENGQENIHQHFFTPENVRPTFDGKPEADDNDPEALVDYLYVDTTPWDKTKHDNEAEITGGTNPVGLKGVIRFLKDRKEFDLKLRLYHGYNSKKNPQTNGFDPFYKPSGVLIQRGTWDINLSIPVVVFWSREEFVDVDPEADVNLIGEDSLDEDNNRTLHSIMKTFNLNLYNFGFAQSRSLPKLSEGLMGLIQMDIMMRGNGRVEQYKGNIVGFSNRLNTILVPQSFMKWANENFAPNAEAQPARLIIEVSNPADSAIASYFQKKGYETEDGKLDAGKTTYFLRLIVGIVLGVGLFISILSFYILMLSIFLLLQKNTTKLESLLLIGYSPNKVALPYQLLTVGLNVIVLVLSIGLVSWLRSYYIDSIQLLFPQLETGSLWAAISMGVVLFIVVSVINILAVKRKVLSIWMHKS